MRHQAPPFHGIPQTSTLYWKTMKFSDRLWSQDEYIEAYKNAGKEFSSTLSVFDDPPYVLVHFRGPNDNTELRDETSFCTRQVLLKLHEAGIRMRIISNNYTHTMKWLRRLPSIEIVHLGNEFSNLQLVLGARSIVQHASNGWSAYTSIPAMAKSIPLINTFYNEYQHRYSILSEYGDVPPEFHTCHQMDDFVRITMRS